MFQQVAFYVSILVIEYTLHKSTTNFPLILVMFVIIPLILVMFSNFSVIFVRPQVLSYVCNHTLAVTNSNGHVKCLI
jgi:hypothetical protein